jgi:hypothetical protein
MNLLGLNRIKITKTSPNLPSSSDCGRVSGTGKSGQLDSREGRCGSASNCQAFRHNTSVPNSLMSPVFSLNHRKYLLI